MNVSIYPSHSIPIHMTQSHLSPLNQTLIFFSPPHRTNINTNTNTMENTNLITTQTQHKSATKLPIKRKTDPIHKNEPDAIKNEEENEEDEDGDEEEYDAANGAVRAPPFKFHRIWSESDEIRFLQGLLGCWSQGMVFPRDLNLFYDRFSESMPQPFTRSQLSEKLRRLRKKFRVVSGRIARGQDPSRLAPHDRDLLHLSTRLWHPSYAASSPFSAPEGEISGGGGNKRRRPNPRGPSGRLGQRNEGNVEALEVIQVQMDGLAEIDVVPIVDDIKLEEVEEKSMEDVPPVFVKVDELPVNGAGGSVVKDDVASMVMKTILGVFDGCVKEARNGLASQGVDELGGSSGVGGSGLERRWRELRIAEMDVLAQRLRLVVDNAVQH